MAHKKDKRVSIVTSRVGTDNRVVFPREAMEALELNRGDEVVMMLQAETKEIIVKKLTDAVSV